MSRREELIVLSEAIMTSRTALFESVLLPLRIFTSVKPSASEAQLRRAVTDAHLRCSSSRMNHHAVVPGEEAHLHPVSIATAAEGWKPAQVIRQTALARARSMIDRLRRRWSPSRRSDLLLGSDQLMTSEFCLGVCYWCGVILAIRPGRVK